MAETLKARSYHPYRPVRPLEAGGKGVVKLWFVGRNFRRVKLVLKHSAETESGRVHIADILAYCALSLVIKP
jgi:hypothetical protein